MEDRDLKFSVISLLVTFVSLGLIIGSQFLENERTKLTVIIAAFLVMILQKIAEIIFVKKTRKVSVAVLLFLVAALGYFIFKKF